MATPWFRIGFAVAELSVSTTRVDRRLPLGIIFFITLIAGLHPHGYDFRNNVAESADEAGLNFSKYGVAYTEPVLDADLVSKLNKSGFELGVSLGPQAGAQEGFALIVQFYSGDDTTQFVVGQYADQVIVMTGDDYKHRIKRPRIWASLSPSQLANGVDLLIRSSNDGASIALDGVIAVTRADLALPIPHSPGDTRVVIGNSVYATHQWQGEIRRFELIGISKTQLAYTMGDLHKHSVVGNGAIDSTLWVPPRRVIVERRYLQWPFGHQFEINRGFLIDLFQNLVGFIPLGFALVWSRVRLPGLNALASAAVVAGLTSLFIELSQAWMPSRDSSALDFTLNTLGGGVGAFLSVWCLSAGEQPGKQ